MPKRRAPTSDPHNWLLGPRAIAVLSCALAMLAANPAFASNRQSQTTGVVSTLDQLPSTSITSVAETPQGNTPKSRKISRNAAQPAIDSPASNSGDTRMLQALAQWSDLLTRQLASILSPALDVAFAESPCMAAPPAVHPSAQPALAAALPPAHESLFALQHCLLAPPLRA